MRILVTSIVDLERSANNRPHQLLEYLSRRHEVTVLSIRDWWKAGQVDESLYRRDFASLFQRLRIAYLSERKMSPVLQEVFAARGLAKRLQGLDDRGFDVHLNYNSLFSGYQAARSLKVRGAYTVYDMADDLAHMIRVSPQIPRPLRPLGGLLGSAMVRRNIKAAHKVTFTTNALREAYDIPQTKAEHLPNGVDTELFRPHPVEEVRKGLGLGQDCVIGYVGVLREWVDFAPVFGAMVRLPQLRMVIVGQEGRFRQNQELAQKYGLGTRVVFTGAVPYHEVPKFVSAMDVCCIPFHKSPLSEGALPLKLFEFMSCERPVISTPLAGVAEAVGDRVLYASTPEEYVQAIARLRASPELGQQMGRAGRELVKQKYSWKGIAQRMEQILEEVAAGG